MLYYLTTAAQEISPVRHFSDLPFARLMPFLEARPMPTVEVLGLPLPGHGLLYPGWNTAASEKAPRRGICLWETKCQKKGAGSGLPSRCPLEEGQEDRRLLKFRIFLLCLVLI